MPPPMATTRSGLTGIRGVKHPPSGSRRILGLVKRYSNRNQSSRICLSQNETYGISGYSNSVNRGSSTMLWKSLSERAWSRFFGFNSMALDKVVEAILRAAGNGVEHRQAVVGVVGGGVVGKNALQLVAGLFEVAGVQLRDGVVIALLGREEGKAAAYRAAAGRWLMYILQRSTISTGAMGSSFSKAAIAFSYLPC